MGIKAVSTPILASEIAFTQWRGSSTLMWQLWSVFKISVLCFRRGVYRDGGSKNVRIPKYELITLDTGSHSE